MILTDKQEQAIKIATERYKNKDPYTIITGYAGSGKTTLINFIIEALGLDRDRVAYLAYTGKAANVLKQKGCPNAMTIHKLLYYSMKDKDGKFHFKKRPHLENNYQLLVVDEISMVNDELWQDLLSYKIYTIGLGDPGQLSPPSKSNTINLLNTPHIFLDQVMRQALDSEIIRLSMWIREGKPLVSYKGENEEVKIVTKNEIVTGMYDWADQVLCATNVTRDKINKEIRQLKGYPEDRLVEQDKIIGLSNHWDFFSLQGNALTNGCIGYVNNYSNDILRFPAFITKKKIPIMNLNFQTDDGVDTFIDVPIDTNFLFTNEHSLTPQEEYKIRGYNKNHNETGPCYQLPYEFTFGNAITVWKAQGSQWNKVLLFEEWFPRDEDEHRRYLYTGITRSISRIVIVKR